MSCRVFLISFLFLLNGSVYAATSIKSLQSTRTLVESSNNHQTQLPKRCSKRRSAKIYLPKKSRNSSFRRDGKRKSMQPKKRLERKGDPVQPTVQLVNPLHDAGLSPQADYGISYQDRNDLIYADSDHQVLSSEKSLQTTSFVGDDALMRV